MSGPGYRCESTKRSQCTVAWSCVRSCLVAGCSKCSTVRGRGPSAHVCAQFQRRPSVRQLGNIAPPCWQHAYTYTLTQPPHSSYTARPLPQTTHTRARTRQAGHAVPVTCADRRRRRHRLLPLSLLFTDCDGWWGRWGGGRGVCVGEACASLHQIWCMCLRHPYTFHDR